MDVRNTPNAMVRALMAAQNARHLAEAQADYFHLQAMVDPAGSEEEPSETLVQVTADNASNEDTRVALANQIKQIVNRHFADAVAHDSELSEAITTADATDDATALTLANAEKAAINAHLDETDVHYNDDTVNDVTNDDATNTTTTNTLLNEMKINVNAHVANAPPGIFLNLVPA